MTTLFHAHTRLEAWLAAVEYLMEKQHDFNLILSIESPDSDGSIGDEAESRVNALYANESGEPIHTVAETIFPGWEYRHRGLRGVFETYAKEYAILKRGEAHRWGTYAHRIVQRTTGAGQVVNPLAALINKMRSEQGQTARGTYRSCYEVGIAEGEYDLPLYSTVDDQGRRRGLPCLSHLSFKLYNGSVHLTAVYRSHDYRNKVFGNMLGLARLQACVAHEVGVSLGTLVIHSTYAYIGGAKAPLKRLVTDLQGLLRKGGDNDMADTIR